MLWTKNAKYDQRDNKREKTTRELLKKERDMARWRKEAKKADARAAAKRREKETRARKRAKSGW